MLSVLCWVFYAECFMLSVLCWVFYAKCFMLSVFMLSVIMLTIVMLRDIMQGFDYTLLAWYMIWMLCHKLYILCVCVLHVCVCVYFWLCVWCGLSLYMYICMCVCIYILIYNICVCICVCMCVFKCVSWTLLRGLKQTRSAMTVRCSNAPASTPWLACPTSRSGRPKGFVNAWLEQTQTWAVKLVPHVYCVSVCARVCVRVSN